MKKQEWEHDSSTRSPSTAATAPTLCSSGSDVGTSVSARAPQPKHIDQDPWSSGHDPWAASEKESQTSTSQPARNNKAATTLTEQPAETAASLIPE